MEHITLLDCNRQTSSEYLGGNTETKSLFTNKIGSGISVNAGDKVSVYNSFVSEIGADDNAINFGNKFLNRRNITYTKLTPINFINGSNDKILGYERITAENVTESVEETENSCNMLINYYKTANGENYFALPRRFCWKNDQIKNDWNRLDEINFGSQNGSVVVTETLTPSFINTSNLQKYFVDDDYFLYETGDFDQKQFTMYKQRNDNSRYKIMIQTDTRYGEQTITPPTELMNGSSMTPANQEYIEYIEKLPISLPRGFLSPSAVSEKINAQLRSQSQPQINNFRSTATETGTTFTNTIARPLNVELNSPTYHTFYSANESTNNQSRYNSWASAVIDNKGALTYLSTLQYIGVKRPDLWLNGRQFAKDWFTKFNASYSGTVKMRVLAQSRITLDKDLLATNFQINACTTTEDTGLIVTNWQWGDKDIMKSMANIFKEQGKHPELFKNEFNVFHEITTVDNSKFLHINILSNGSRAPLPLDNRRTSLGWDYMTDALGSGQEWLNTIPFFFDFNPEYEDIETDGESWEQGYSYGVFLKYRNSIGLDVVAFTTKKLGDKMKLKYTDINASRITTIPRFLFYLNNASTNVKIAKDTSLGWDINFNSYGNAVIGLMDGWCKNMYHETEKTVMLPTAYDSASVPAGHYSQKIYLGANEPQLNYNTVSNRFEIKNLHTAERVQNYYNAGGVKNDASGNPVAVVPEFATAGDKVYKINKRLYNTNYTPSVLPYDCNSNTITILDEDAGTYTVDLLNQNLQGWTIYDQYTGIIIKDFGYDEKYWDEGIFGTLGFSYEQFNTPRTSKNDITTRVGNSNKFALPYAFTNADVGQLDTMDFVTNVFGAGMYSLQLPTTMSFNSTLDAGGTVFRKAFPQEQFPPITETAESVVLTAPNLPRKLKNGYYCIRSDILDGSQYLGGADSGELYPVIAVVPKSNDFGDFYVGGESTLSFVFTRPKTITSVTTSIHNPDQTLANVDDSCAVIYKITKTLSNNFDIVQQIMDEANPQKK